MHRGGGSRGDSELAYGACGALRISSPEGFFPTVRATAVQRSVQSVVCIQGLRRVTSRGSQDVQLHNNELEYITYLAGDLKRKE